MASKLKTGILWFILFTVISLGIIYLFKALTTTTSLEACIASLIVAVFVNEIKTESIAS
jgi:hypothetical protein